MTMLKEIQALGFAQATKRKRITNAQAHALDLRIKLDQVVYDPMQELWNYEPPLMDFYLDPPEIHNNDL